MDFLECGSYGARSSFGFITSYKDNPGWWEPSRPKTGAAGRHLAILRLIASQCTTWGASPDGHRNASVAGRQASVGDFATIVRRSYSDGSKLTSTLFCASAFL